MTYRDELDAARQRNEDLARELAEAQEKIAELEAGAKAKLVVPEAPTPLAVRPPVRLGRIHFHRPPTWVPMLHLFRTSVRAALARAPKLSKFDSDSVLAWVVHHVVLVPVTYAVRLPLYYLSLCMVLPVALAVCLVFSVPLSLLLLASRFRFGSDPPPDSGWLHGEVDEDAGAMFLWVLESLCMQPLLLTTTSLLEGMESSSSD